MARRCPNCGEDNLPDKAQFCYVCGTALPETETRPASDEAAFVDEQGATRHMPVTGSRADEGFAAAKSGKEPIDEDGHTFTIPDPIPATEEGETRLMPEPESEPDEAGSTSFMPEPGPGLDEKGATRSMLDPLAADEAGSTRFMPRSDNAEDEGSTGFMSMDDGEGLTKNLPEPTADDEAGLTRAMPEPDAPDEDGATRTMPEAKNTDDEGATRFMPKAESQTTSGQSDQTAVAAPDNEEGSTRLMPGLETADFDSDAPTLADEAVDADTADQAAAETEPPAKTTPPNGTGLKLGHVLQDRYRLDTMLGKGGFGAVYLAEDIKLTRRCVVKRMRTRGRSPEEIRISRLNFEREAKLLAELNDPGHPNIPEIYDYFSDKAGNNYLVMKFIEGRNLRFVIDHGEESIPWREAIRYAFDVCDALNYMHNHGAEPVVHRDIKPANILLGEDGRVWLVDFGLAKADPVEGTDEEIKATRASGSLGYTPLEQWLGDAVPTSDVYALGAMLHHLVTGCDPLDAYGGEFHINKIRELHGQFPPIRRFDRKLPKRLDEIIQRAVTAKPEERPTALQLQQQLKVLISGAQEAALYTFKNGKSAKTIGALVDLCEQNRQESEEYLYNGDFERWFLLINRNDLAAAATQAVKETKTRKEGLERFLKLILPNLFARRLRRAGLHLVRGSLQFGLSAILIIFLVALGGSYVLGFILQRAIGTTAWEFSRLDLTRDNHFTEAYVTEQFDRVTGPYVDDLKVEISPPDHMDIKGRWSDYAFDLGTSIRMGVENPRLHVISLNQIPLFWIAQTISQGINNGIDQAFQEGPVDVTALVVKEGEIVFTIKDSADPARPEFATPTPAPTLTPTPTPTPTPVNIVLVIAFNELQDDIILEIDDQTWDIAANDSQAIEILPGTYNFTVRDKATEEIVAQGSKTWTLNRAYRLRINLLEN